MFAVSTAYVGMSVKDSMKIGIDNALGIAGDALSMRSQRTQLLASNIANADTPGYKARDLDFKSLLANQLDNKSPMQLSASNSHHLLPGQNDVSSAIKYRVPLMPSLDGNSVDTQMEQSAFAENSVEFLTNLRILNGRIQGMLTAIKGE